MILDNVVTLSPLLFPAVVIIIIIMVIITLLIIISFNVDFGDDNSVIK